MDTAHRLDGNVAIVTGASRGIGAAIAAALAERGARVVVSSRSQESVDRVASALRDRGLEAAGIACHAGRPDQLAGLVEQTVAAFGGIDILINNAATNPVFAPLLDTSPEAFDKILDVNLKGPLELCKLVYPHMKARGAGSIVNISSIAGLRPEPGLGGYSISKAALQMMTQALAVEWTPVGIRVNAVCPGIIQTKFSEALWTDPAMKQRLDEQVPARRIGQPEEVAGLVVFLASDAARYCTGGVYTVDGGYTLV
ncbi:MAG: SDR family oxidoreductase [Rhodothermales bacterium]